MKKFFLFCIITLISVMYAGAKDSLQYVQNGTEFAQTTPTKTEVKTAYTWKDKDGKVYPIYLSKRGKAYIYKISKKSNKPYKYYLPDEIAQQISKGK